MMTHSAGPTILTGVGVTLIDLIFTVFPLIALQTLTNIVSQTVVDARGLVLTRCLTLAGIQVCIVAREPHRETCDKDGID